MTDALLNILLVEDNPLDLVITDYTMPHMTGESLAQAFRQIRLDIPIILTTGFSPMAPEQAQAFGIETVLSKPWMARDRACTIQRVLAERHREHV